MSNTAAPGSDPAMEAAIERVLAAERDARSAIRDSQTRAVEIVAAARASAQRVAACADSRLREVHGAFQRKVEAEIAAIEAEIAALNSSSPEGGADTPPDGAEALAVAALAAELTGDVRG